MLPFAFPDFALLGGARKLAMTGQVVSGVRTSGDSQLAFYSLPAQTFSSIRSSINTYR